MHKDFLNRFHDNGKKIAHFGHFAENVLCESDLGTGAEKVVVYLFAFEIDIALEVIGQEARGKLERYRKHSVGQGRNFVVAYLADYLRHEALGECFVIIKIEIDAA